MYKFYCFIIFFFFVEGYREREKLYTHKAFKDYILLQSGE